MRKLLTVIQAAEMLGIHRITLYKLIEAKKIPHIRKKGLGIRLDPDELDKWTRSGEIKSDEYVEN